MWGMRPQSAQAVNPPHHQLPARPPPNRLAPQEAAAARDQTNNYQLDKNHKFVVNLFDDFDRYARVPEEYQAPDAKAFAPHVSGRRVCPADRGVHARREPYVCR